MNEPTVFIGSPVHNKVWCIEEYIKCLERLEYPKDKISLVFFINDSVDGTKEILAKELRRLIDMYDYRRVEIYEENFGYFDTRLTEIRAGNGIISVNDKFSHFATVRNRHKNFLQDEEYFFSVDCDILIRPKTLKMLLADNKDMIGIPINNEENRTDGRDAIWPNSCYNMAIMTEKGFRPWKNFRWNCTFPVDLTGACALMRSEIAKKVNYRSHDYGEDAGFCSLVLASGYSIFINSNREYEGDSVIATHAMNKIPDIYYIEQEVGVAIS